MGGVDLLDSLIGRSKIRMRSRKWYLRLFYHLLDLTVVNAWLLYRRVEAEKGNEKTKRLIEFKGEIAYSLTNAACVRKVRGRPSSVLEHMFETKRKRGATSYVPPKDVRKDQTAHWPSYDEQRQRCKYPGCKGFSYIKCTKCKTHLCLNKNNNCFLKFHEE